MPRSTNRPSFAPCLQVLEGRECPAGISLANGVLSVAGTAGVDTVTITQDDVGGEVVVTDGRQLIVYGANHVSTVFVGLDAGEDEFRYELLSDFEYPNTSPSGSATRPTRRPSISAESTAIPSTTTCT